MAYLSGTTQCRRWWAKGWAGCMYMRLQDTSCCSSCKNINSNRVSHLVDIAGTTSLVPSHPCQGTSTHSNMMTSSNRNIFRVTGPLCGEFTGYQWIPRTKASDEELWCFLWSAPWINGWVNNPEAGDLRRQRAHYDVIVMRNVTGDELKYFELAQVVPINTYQNHEQW